MYENKTNLRCTVFLIFKPIPLSTSPLSIIHHQLPKRFNTQHKAAFIEVEIGGVAGGYIELAHFGIFAAQEKEEGGYFFGVEGKVFGAGGGYGDPDIAFAGRGFEAGYHLGGEFGIVVGDGVARGDGHFCGGTGTFCDIGSGAVNFGVDGSLHVGIEGTDGAYEGDFFGDDVVSDTAVDLSDGDHCRFPREVCLPTDDGLKAHDHLCANHNGIYAGPGAGAVGLFALDFDFEAIGGGHGSSGFVLDFARVEAWCHVQAKHGLNAVFFDQAFFDEEFSTTLFSNGGAFFGGLKDKDDLS